MIELKDLNETLRYIADEIHGIKDILDVIRVNLAKKLDEIKRAIGQG